MKNGGYKYYQDNTNNISLESYNCKLLLEKVGENKIVNVFENENNYVLITDTVIMIIPRLGNKKVNSILPLFDALNVYLGLCKSLYDVELSHGALQYLVRTKELVKSMEEVKSKYLHVDCNRVCEKYNIKRDTPVNLKALNFESYETEYKDSYFNEMKICYCTKLNFSTAEYYDDNIGYVSTDIMTYYPYTGNNSFTLKKVDLALRELKDTHFDILVNLMNIGYIDKILFNTI